MKTILLLLALISPFWASADPVEELLAKKSPAPVAAKSSLCSDIVADPLNGIVLVGSWEKVCKEPNNLSGIQADGVALLSDHPGFLKNLQDEFVGKTLTQGALWKLREEISDFYCAQGQPFVIVSVPKQRLANGVIQIVVIEPTLGNITVRGSQFFSPDRIKRFIRQKPGHPIDGLQLVQDMARMNQNPFRRTDAIFRPGRKPGIADLELATIDRWPYRIYLGADNTGTVATERNRFIFGFNFGKTIVEDSELSYQFTCSPNWNRFIAHTALCRVPFPARQMLLFYGGYSKVEPKLPSPDTEKSESWQVDGRYRIPIITNTSFLQEFILGFDYKQVICRIKRDGVKAFDNLATIDQFMVGYDLGHRSRRHKLALVAEVYGAPGGMSHGNTTEKFVDFRPGSGPQYAYFKLSHSFAYRFDHFWVSYDINGQLSTKNLLPSEQFTLAGYNAVRGFEERIISTDNAILVNLVLETPRLSIGKLAGWSRRSFDELYFLGFFDFGYGGSTNPLIGESRTVSLASAGPGVRYQIDRYVSARFDYGFQLWHHGFHNSSHSRYNFGLLVSF